MKRSMTFLAFTSLAALITACSSSEMDNTEMGAVSGGVVGAGLGAIIGGATGNTAGGLAIGATAGTAAGAGAGYSLQQGEDQINAQDQIITERQQHIDANRVEIDSLKALSSERVAFADTPQPYRSSVSFDSSAPSGNYRIAEKSLVEKQVEIAPIEVVSEVSEPVEIAKIVPAPVEPSVETRDLTPECKQAYDEAKEGEQAEDISDKLFHVRRALRLCPQESNYHNRLGELYVSLDRTSDAEFEFQQALTLKPDHSGAKVNLDNLRKY